ncbi:FAD-binding oxidoreductase [Brevundimonas sp. TWP2-3-4b1]|uniref:FAD-binding oxidoreductase n=1 Tax=Brevundimonas sp. TWP2-3-4b1 TaxID=2804580 RepID=UPI003CE677FA
MLSDFGGFPPGTPQAVCRPTSLYELQAAMADCAARRRQMRTRCFAHSMNGMAVPRSDETLIDLTGVRHIVWNGRGAITVGAGLAVWDLDQYVRRFGWKLPVVNDGGAAASSVGGLIAAGGIGEGCMLHGGFWESVASLVLVTAAGEVRTVTRDNPVFPWLFGSFGALGVVYEAVIDLVPASSARPRRVVDTPALPEQARTVWPPHLWLTLFVTGSQLEDAIACLHDLASANPGVWRPRSAYEYFVLHRRFNPPLVFEAGRDFIAVGVWGDRSGEDADLSGYLAMEAGFQALVEARGWRRYFQSELIRDRRPLDRYVGSDTADAFHALKAAWDPAGLLNAFMAPA